MVAVVDQGRVAELGTHEDLLEQGRQEGGGALGVRVAPAAGGRLLV
jgi:hypothetical protein